MNTATTFAPTKLVMPEHFIVPTNKDMFTCPICGKKMLLRRSRFGVFLGCADYPNCKGIVPCDKDGNPLRVVKEEDRKCTLQR